MHFSVWNIFGISDTLKENQTGKNISIEYLKTIWLFVKRAVGKMDTVAQDDVQFTPTKLLVPDQNSVLHAMDQVQIIKKGFVIIRIFSHLCKVAKMFHILQ